MWSNESYLQTKHIWIEGMLWHQKEMKVMLLQMKWKCCDLGDKGVGRCVKKAT
jgi:hypothetical protein